jgi:hypothetical protein
VTKRATVVEWDTSTPKELKDQATTIRELATGIQMLQAILSGSNRDLNIDELTTRFNVPLLKTDSKPGRLLAVAPEPAANDMTAEAAE